MRTPDYIGFAAALSFGLSWLIAPRSVIAFYTRFHRGVVTMPKPFGVRIAGALWLMLILVVLFIFSRTPA
jgi:hypothetical protein